MIEPVDDPDDPRLEPYRGVRERDLVGRQGRFIAEGQVVLERLVAQSRHQTLSVLIAAKRLEALQPILERLPSDTPVYSASQAVMDAVVGFHIHRGILALAAAAPPADPAGLLQTLGADALVVVLCGVANHDNMGGVFRNAAAFGVGAVLLDAHCCDPLYRKAIRVSVGGVLSVPFARLAADADLPRTLAVAGFEGLALSPGGATTLAQVRRPRRCAVVFGTEGEGLPADLLARMTSVRIPMAHGFDSLNLATTCGIVLHQLA
ncbi:MAG: RNA methyltransferase [Phenylobacterium sp.]|uniref:TrmH family RNA methyltransferase n=1 Tax=Phenylobacterium sp. TaxID=1871053 RepID=UPI0027349520|nr:RNA methyltransferase [Phenylobacterium sp.]MDP3175204.1 RNA methyltransferase [Phenylobacterium sp.]